MRHRVAPWMTAAVLPAILSACVAPTGSRPGVVEPEPAREESVRPGINAEYKDPDVSQWVGRFETESREIFREREQIVQLIGLKKGARVADIGAGTGLFSALFAREVGPKGMVFAVDIVPEFLEHIRERAKDAGLTNIRTVLCRENSVELPPDSLDVAFLCDTYHHFEYPRSTLRSIHRALRPGGTMMVVDFERIQGVSREWVMNHVRAGRETVIAEIEAAGFRRTESSAPFLKENYVLRFGKSTIGKNP